MNTYGPLSNASLLHVYGFSEEGNPHNVVGDVIFLLAIYISWSLVCVGIDSK